MNYIEVAIEITPYTEEYAEIVMAMLDDIPFESFSTEEPLLKGYIGQDNFNQQNLKTVLSLRKAKVEMFHTMARISQSQMKGVDVYWAMWSHFAMKEVDI